MSREMKYQVWDKKYGKMYTEGICIYADGSFDVQRTAEDGRAIETAESEGGELVLREYTGLRDREGREIYDGDYSGLTYEACEVRWCDECGGWSLGPIEVSNYCHHCHGDFMWGDFVNDVRAGTVAIVGNRFESLSPTN